MNGRKRKSQIHFRVSEYERSIIIEKMNEVGILNMGTFLRKMALEGYIIHIDLSDIRELLGLLRRVSNNLNQFTKRAHETGNIYIDDINYLNTQFKILCKNSNDILIRLSSL